MISLTVLSSGSLSERATEANFIRMPSISTLTVSTAFGARRSRLSSRRRPLTAGPFCAAATTTKMKTSAAAATTLAAARANDFRNDFKNADSVNAPNMGLLTSLDMIALVEGSRGLVRALRPLPHLSQLRTRQPERVHELLLREQTHLEKPAVEALLRRHLFQPPAALLAGLDDEGRLFPLSLRDG